MKTPPFLMWATLLFWGWLTDLLPLGIVMGMVLELSRRLSWRWDLSSKEFNRIWDLTMLLLLGAGIYSYSGQDLSYSLLAFIQCLPLIFFFFMTAQSYGSREKIELSTFFWTWRKHHALAALGAGINVSYLYFALCLLAASAAHVNDLRFYLGLSILGAWAIWTERPRRQRGPRCAVLLLAVIWMGHQTHTWLRGFQSMFEKKTVEWFASVQQRVPEDLAIDTAMGRIGELKLSGHIVLRVEPHDPENPPSLLRQAAYNQLIRNTWYSRGHRNFVPATKEQSSTWQLVFETKSKDSAAISYSLKDGKGLLPLPPQTSRLSALPFEKVERNRLGVVRVTGGPNAVRFEAHYNAGAGLDGPPDEIDLRLPAEDRAAFSRVADELGLGLESPEEVLETVSTFFQKHFRYSTYLGSGHQVQTEQTTPLSKFLLRYRVGHCEYFASATVLLLRAAGLPARYATGYAVQKTSRQGNSYLVRERHGHAWVLVYLNGEWRDFDTTPIYWSEVEEENASFFEPLSDQWSALAFKFSRWHWLMKRWALSRYLIGLFAILVSGMIWRIVWKRHRTRMQPLEEAVQAQPGADSEFYLIEVALEKLGAGRNPGETVATWFQRVSGNGSGVIPGSEGLCSILSLHYRYRFDPQGLGPEERTDLATQARKWLAVANEWHKNRRKRIQTGPQG